MLGAAYLIYLGLRMLLRHREPLSNPAVQPEGPRRALLEGVVVEALNVKTALFFLAFLPQFTSPDTALVPQLLLMGMICVVLNTAVDVLAVLGAHRLIQSGPARAARARWMTRASGLTMLGLGAFLALARRDA
jgi:threonine/homoserine/homoserine lactone efflux protein